MCCHSQGLWPGTNGALHCKKFSNSSATLPNSSNLENARKIRVKLEQWCHEIWNKQLDNFSFPLALPSSENHFCWWLLGLPWSVLFTFYTKYASIVRTRNIFYEMAHLIHCVNHVNDQPWKLKYYAHKLNWFLKTLCHGGNNNNENFRNVTISGFMNNLLLIAEQNFKMRYGILS